MNASTELVINVSQDGLAASDLKAALEAGASTTSEKLTVRVPRPAPGGLAMLDPSTVQIILAALSGTGALAITLKGIFTWINTSAKAKAKAQDKPIKIKIGKETLEIPHGLSESERNKLIEAFAARVSKKS